MLLSNIPTKFPVAFASSAGAGYIRTIPQAPTGTPGQASLSQGFPPENFNPVAAGGVPPFGQDFNGLLNQISLWNQWQATGVVFPPYDATFQVAIGGYPQSAIVQSLVQAGLLYWSIVDNNLTNPDAGGAGWIVWYRKVTANTDIYVNASTGNDSNNGLTPSTALATFSAAIALAWTFPPSQYVVTIHFAAGTYIQASTPLYSGPTLVVDGGSAASVTITGNATGTCFSVNGPNSATVKNVNLQNSLGTGAAGALVCGQGANLTTLNTTSGAVGGAVFQALEGGTIFVGTHTFNGSCDELFFSQFFGTIQFQQNANYTIGAAITVRSANAVASSGGGMTVPGSSAPTWTNPGNLTGSRYSASINGFIVANGNGTTWFPGTIAGATATGGQYSP